MIEKIISCGQTGVAQAAIDVAIKLDIHQESWIPRDRKTEAEILPKNGSLEELEISSYAAGIERNVLNSDGTLIFTPGALIGDSALTQRMASEHGCPWLHIDLSHKTAFSAAIDISTWIKDHSISVLHVAGSRANEDPKVYDTVMGILESALILGLSKGPRPDSLQTLLSTKERSKERSFKPRTVKEALEDLMVKLPLKDRTSIANMSEQELGSLQFSLGKYIRNNYGSGGENEALFASCRFLLKKDTANEDEVSSLIIKELWKKLRKTHRLRVVR